MIQARNSDEFNIKKEQILEFVTQEQLFERYLGYEVDYKKAFTNPYRIDKHKGCRFYCTNTGKILFNDFSRGYKLDCFDCASKYYGISHFQTVLNLIGSEYRLFEKIVLAQPALFLSGEKSIIIPKKSVIKVKVRDYTNKDYDYWKQFNITDEVLDYYKVKAIQYYWVNGELKYEFSIKDPCYCYLYPDRTYKLYHPFRDKSKVRFITNSNYIQGYNHISKGENLIITKSMKDVMSLATFGVDAIAESSENVIIDKETYLDLSNRYENIWILKDYDTAGFRAARKYRNEYFNSNIIFVRDIQAKDFSGLIKYRGIEEAKRWLDKYNLI